VTVTDPDGQKVTLTSSKTITVTPGVYSISVAPVVVGSNTYYATQASQIVSAVAGTTATSVIDYFDVVSNTTKVLDQTGGQSLVVSSDGSTVTISSASGVAQSLQSGDVLVSAPTPSASSGLLVRVLSVTNNGTTVVASVSKTTLDQAIQRGSISYTQTFTPSSAQRIKNQLPGARILTLEQAKRAGIHFASDTLPDACSGNSSTFIEPFSYTISKQGGISSGATGVNVAGQVQLTGTIEFCPQLQMDFQWGFLSLNSAKVVASFGEHALVTIQGQLSTSLQLEKDSDQIPLTEPIVIFVGDVPVVLQATAQFYVGASLGADASFYASAEQDAQAQAGISYASGHAAPIQSATNSIANDGTSLDGDLAGQFDLGLKIGVLVYDTLTPNVATDVYVRGTDTPTEVLSWGLESNVGVNASIIDTDVNISLSSPELNLFNQTIWQESGSFDPTLETVVPGSANAGSADVPVALVGSNFVPDSLVTFNGIALSTTFSGPENIAATIPAKNLLDSGSYPITVTSPDTSEAISNAFNFMVNGSSSNPVPSIISLSPSSLLVGATPQTLKINGTGFLTSSTATFNGIAHAVAFVNASLLTISLTSADLATPGIYPVVVMNPAPGGGSSGPANVSVSNSQTTNEWSWMSGADTIGQPVIYGTQGVPGTANNPGSRLDAVSWIDGNGNFWLFGGAGGANEQNNYGDLWAFSPITKTWTWVSGSNAINSPGVYGTRGVPAATNTPGSRINPVSWMDGNGNFWLFGGIGGSGNYLNDLWKFTPKAKTWTWVSGSETGKASGVYGNPDAPSTANVPGARTMAVSWIDGTGNLWLFGGEGFDSNGTQGNLNDLWEFNPTAGTWAWEGGYNTTIATMGVDGGHPGVYGTLGVPSVTNLPGGRDGGISWVDKNGNFWLFGGRGIDSTGTNGNLNDLWQYSPTVKNWTWVSGSQTANAPSVYGTEGIPSTANTPGGRYGAVSWLDNSGNLWLFGGVDNDLWKFDPKVKDWTWMSGNKTANAPGLYGTEGIPSKTNVPGSRFAPVTWVDGNGNLWLLGGVGIDSTGAIGVLNDLWRYQP
jgi:hypothetical protein